MNVFCDIKNIGDSPAIQIYTKAGLKFKFVEDDDSSFFPEYSYAGSFATNDKHTLCMSFDDYRLLSLLDNLSIMCENNTNKVEKGENLTKAGTLVIDCVYSNIHHQYFKTTYERDIIGITAINGEDKRNIIMSNVPKLKDSEEFKLMLINPSLSHLEIKLLSDVEANEFINKYRTLNNVYYK